MKSINFLTEGTRTSPASRLRVYLYLDQQDSDFGGLRVNRYSFTSDSYCRCIVSGGQYPFWRRVLEKFYQLIVLARMLIMSIGAVCFIQRVLPPVWYLKVLAFVSKRLVYDFDDAVYLGGIKRRKRFEALMSAADSVVAVSKVAAGKALELGADKDSTFVIPTPVDCRSIRLLERRQNFSESDFVVGWIGSPATTEYLESMFPVLERFAALSGDIRFVFIGARQFSSGSIGDRVIFSDWSPLAERELLPQLDVGIMPLEDNDWTRGKGGYKLIQYMAAGVATVSSPVGANREIVIEGETGFFADSESAWLEMLESLFKDRELCKAFGAAGRKRAEEVYDISVTAKQFFNVLRSGK